jgi:hypothetical protein
MSRGLLQELSPGALAPEARIMPLGQAASCRQIVQHAIIILHNESDVMIVGLHGLGIMGTTRCQLRLCPHCNWQDIRFQSHRNLDPGALHPDMSLTRHDSQTN